VWQWQQSVLDLYPPPQRHSSLLLSSYAQTSLRETENMTRFEKVRSYDGSCAALVWSVVSQSQATTVCAAVAKCTDIKTLAHIEIKHSTWQIL